MISVGKNLKESAIFLKEVKFLKLINLTLLFQQFLFALFLVFLSHCVSMIFSHTNRNLLLASGEAGMVFFF